jgi:anaerobic selenocysteine-containing dehydrogenase
MIEQCGGIQWPCGEGLQPSSAELCGDDFQPSSAESCSHGLQPSAIIHRSEVENFRYDGGYKPPPQQRRLFEDGKFFTPDTRARFIFDTPRPVPEPPDADYPFILLTGRGTSAQWHTQTRTAKSAILRKLYPAEIYVEINPADAEQLDLHDGGTVRVVSRRAAIAARLRLTATIRRGHVFLPMHYPEVNQLTLWSIDPHSRQPAYKHCAVRIEAISK